jgi:hypothetical protein
MTAIDVINKLENVILPDVDYGNHRQELRNVLLTEYARIQNKTSIKHPNWIQDRTYVWKTVIVTSAAWILVVLAVVFSVLTPIWHSESAAARAINTVMNSTEIKTALAGDNTTGINITEKGKQQMEVVIESYGGKIISALVDTSNNIPNITEITIITLIGSPFDEKTQVSPDERNMILNLANKNHAFRELIEKGSIVDEIRVENSIVTVKNTDTGEIDETRNRTAILQLSFLNKTSSVFINLENGRVIIGNASE